MKVTRAQADEHREALLEQGGRLLRRHGIAGVSIADVARAAGLTHGAFYGHFASKTALVAESVAASLGTAAQRWRARAAANPGGLEAIIAAYLTPRHRDAPEAGCALAAIGPELARADPKLAAALHAGTEGLLAVLDDQLALRHPALAAAQRRARALAILSALTGGLATARALAADPDASTAALHAAARLAHAAADLPNC